MFKTINLLRTGFLTVISVYLFPSIALAQFVSPEAQKLGKSMVYITLSGIGAVGTPSEGIELPGVTGSGFLYDADGRIITSRHLLDVLKAQGPQAGTIKYHVQIGDIYAPKRPAFFDSVSPNKDVMVLRTYPNPSFEPAFISSDPRKTLTENGVRVCAIGKPGASGLPHNPCGNVSSFFGIPPDKTYAWQTDFHFGVGMSGGPIYSEQSGTVVGFVMGRIKSRNTTIGLMVPMSEILPLLPKRSSVPVSLVEPASNPVNTSIDNAILRYIQTDSEEIIDRTRTFHHKNNHCQSSRPIRWVITPSDGAQIIVDSVKIDADRSSRTPEPRLEVVDGNIIVTGIVRNRGECLRVFGSTLAKDARGSIKIKASYKEMTIVEESKLIENLVSLTPGSKQLVDIPMGASDFELLYEVNGFQELSSLNANNSKIKISESVDGKFLEINSTSLR